MLVSVCWVDVCRADVGGFMCAELTFAELKWAQNQSQILSKFCSFEGVYLPQNFQWQETVTPQKCSQNHPDATRTQRGRMQKHKVFVTLVHHARTTASEKCPHMFLQIKLALGLPLPMHPPI